MAFQAKPAFAGFLPDLGIKSVSFDPVTLVPMVIVENGGNVVSEWRGKMKIGPGGMPMLATKAPMITVHWTKIDGSPIYYDGTAPLTSTLPVISAGGSETVTWKATPDPGFLSQAYAFSIIIDPDNDLVESNEANNKRDGQRQSIGFSDLTIQHVSFDETTLLPTITILNKGYAPSEWKGVTGVDPASGGPLLLTSPPKLEVYWQTVGGAPVNFNKKGNLSAEIPAISPGATHTFIWNEVPSSDFFNNADGYTVIIDPARTFPELDKSNNQTSGARSKIAFPDLGISNVSFDPATLIPTVTVTNLGFASSDWHGKSKIGPGGIPVQATSPQKISVFWTRQSDGSPVYYQGSDPLVATLPAISAGGTYTLTWKNIMPDTSFLAEAYAFNIVVDYDNDILELDEKNNTISGVYRQAQDTEQTKDVIALEKVAAEANRLVKTPQEVIADLTVNSDDLDERTPKILPDSPLYIFKRIGRGVVSAFTFDPVKKAEKHLHYANQKLLEANILSEKGNFDAAAMAVEDYENEKDSIRRKADDLALRKEQDASRVELFLTRATNYEIKHQKLLKEIQERLPEATGLKVEETRKKAVGHTAELLEKVGENHSRIIINALDVQGGSDFAMVKNIEILQELKANMSEVTKDTFDIGIGETLKEFRKNLDSEQNRVRFAEYITYVPGNPVVLMEILEKTRIAEDRQEPAVNLDLIREQLLVRTRETILRASSEKQDELLLPLLDCDSVIDARVMSELLRGVPSALVEKIETKSKEMFRRCASTILPQTGRVELDADWNELSELLRNDIGTIELLKSAKVFASPEQVRIIEDKLQETEVELYEKLKNEEFVHQFVEPSVHSIEVLTHLREQAPKEARQAIDRAIEINIKKLEQHIETVKDPETIQTITRELEESKDTRTEIEVKNSEFLRQTEARTQELEAQRQLMEEEQLRLLEERKRYILEHPGEVEAAPEIIERIQNLGQSVERQEVSKPICPEVIEHVCGIDNQTYANACRAEIVGMEVAYLGECMEPLQPILFDEGFSLPSAVPPLE